MVVNGIDTKDISVVVQGAVDKENTPICLKSIRRHLPGAEIVMSTWEETDVNGLDYDVLLLNRDPGAVRDKVNESFVNNTLRQLVSTKAGVEKASCPYILKIRSDLIFKSVNFLNLFDCFDKRDVRYKVFEHRVIFSSFFTKKFCSSEQINQPLPFHVSDWFVFGTRKDVAFLFDIPLPEEPLNSWYLDSIKFSSPKINLLRGTHRYAPEQYIFYCVCKKVFPEISFDHYMDYDKENIEWSERLIANNCIILDPQQVRFICGKEKAGHDRYKRWTKYKFTIPETLRRGLYTHDVFLADYIKYCETRDEEIE